MKKYFNNQDDKKSFINSVFSSVASKYDIMNDVMSFGFHRLWKKNLIDLVNIIPNGNYLDIASGTGDIAIKISQKAKKKNCQINITCLDQNKDMLDIARENFINKNLYSQNLKFITSSAEDLKLEKEIFDYITLSFGIRNFSDIQKSLDNIYKATKEGGYFLCLEFSPTMQHDYMQKIYNQYSKIIPKMGKIITQDEKSYQYLVDSIKNFHNKEDFKDMIKKSGFKFVDYKELSFGICNIHFAQKI